MNNMFFIAQREYLERVRTKAFLTMTILIPALAFGFTIVPSLISSRFSGDAKHLVVATADLQTAELIRAQMNPTAEAALFQAFVGELQRSAQ